MIWLSWRQQRTETVITAALVALLAAVLIPAGLHLASLYHQQDIARCIGRDTNACHDAIANFGGHAGILRSLISGGWFNLLPGLIGVALAIPIVLDLESGTIRLAWTQSVTRGRWLRTKLSLPILTTLAAGGAYSLLCTWYRQPLDLVYGRFDSFDVEGTVPLAYVLFALGLALAVGVLWRRTGLAVLVAFASYVGVRMFVDTWLRQRFLTPLVATWGPPHQGPDLTRAWILFEGPSNRAGHIFNGNYAVLQACSRKAAGSLKGTLDQHCLARHGAGFNHAIYQPASRFWEFQGIETTLFAGIALLLLAFAAWSLRRRPA